MPPMRARTPPGRLQRREGGCRIPISDLFSASNPGSARNSSATQDGTYRYSIESVPKRKLSPRATSTPADHWEQFARKYASKNGRRASRSQIRAFALGLARRGPGASSSTCTGPGRKNSRRNVSRGPSRSRSRSRTPENCRSGHNSSRSPNNYNSSGVSRGRGRMPRGPGNYYSKKRAFTPNRTPCSSKYASSSESDSDLDVKAQKQGQGPGGRPNHRHAASALSRNFYTRQVGLDDYLSEGNEDCGEAGGSGYGYDNGSFRGSGTTSNHDVTVDKENPRCSNVNSERCLPKNNPSPIATPFMVGVGSQAAAALAQAQHAAGENRVFRKIPKPIERPLPVFDESDEEAQL